MHGFTTTPTGYKLDQALTGIIEVFKGKRPGVLSTIDVESAAQRKPAVEQPACRLLGARLATHGASVRAI